MKRRIEFPKGEAKNQSRFELLYGAIILGITPGEKPRGIEVIRREGRLLDALDACSRYAGEDGRKLVNNEPYREVNEGATFIIEQADHELLKKRLETGVEWTPSKSRAVVDCTNWLGAAPEVAEASAG